MAYWSLKEKERSKKRLEYFKKYSKEHYNKEENREYHKEYYQKNKEKLKRYFKDTGYYLKNKEKLDESNKKSRKRMRLATFEKLGGKCIRCGFTDYRALQVDHVSGGGEKERAKIHYWTIYKKIMNDNQNEYQLLCANCNWIKRYENNEWRGVHI